MIYNKEEEMYEYQPEELIFAYMEHLDGHIYIIQPKHIWDKDRCQSDQSFICDTVIEIGFDEVAECIFECHEVDNKDAINQLRTLGVQEDPEFTKQIT